MARTGGSILVRLVVYLLVGHLVAAAAAADSPFDVEPEMTRWARDVAGRERRPERILNRLATAVGTLGIQETELETGTAREVFHSRRANCAGFAFLVVGLARSLGVEALVVEVSDLVRSDQRGGLVILHRHVAVGVWVEGMLWAVDREGVLSSERYRFHVLEDHTAFAIYHSNRGAELLLGGRLDGALEHLERAVEIDPHFGPAWGNLRIARRRAESR